MKRIICFILAVCILVPLISCAETGSTTTAGVTSAAPMRTVGDDGLPELNFSGETVVFLTEGERLSDFKRETITNDVLNDALYNMNSTVESRLKIKLTYATSDDAAGTARDSVLTGLDEYQIVGGHGTGMTQAAIEVNGGVFLNILGGKLKYIDTDREWWSSYMVENTTVYGVCPVITGALSLDFTKDIITTFFNKNMLEENGFTENMYELVKSGGWTIGKQLDMIKGFYSDLTGDGKTMDDRYGLLFDSSPITDAFWSAFDLSLLSRTEDGGVELVSDHTKFADALLLIHSMAFENRDIIWNDALQYPECVGSSYVYDETLSSMFAERQGLFAMLKLRDCELEVMRNMKDDYGIIPLPKWDENQSEYYTYVADRYTVFAVPKTVKNTDATSAALEAMAIEAYKFVAPAYFDKVLRGRYTRDKESSEMIEYIADHIKLDMAWIHTFALEKLSLDSLRYNLIDNQGSSFSSFWRGNKSRYNKAIRDFNEAYANYEE